MNNKGQADELGLGMLIIVAITVIVGAILLQVSAQQVGETNTLHTVVNQTHTAAANGATFYITTSRSATNVVVHNASDGAVIAAGNYTVANNQVNNGALVVGVTVDDAEFAAVDWNLSYTSQPLTYIPESGARGLAALIIIMFALAVAVAAMIPVLRSGVLASMTK